jgi:hypothetical protein
MDGWGEMDTWGCGRTGMAGGGGGGFKILKVEHR